MNKEEQRIAIAEACGFTSDSWCLTTNGWLFADTVPDYLNDLNAMHEALKTLNEDQMVSMDHHLDVVVGNGKQGLNYEYFLWSATAAQLAEAFLFTIGKWKE
jgi:hypothetical protein